MKLFVTALCLLFFIFLEHLRPFYKDKGRNASHVLTNVAVAITGQVLSIILIASTVFFILHTDYGLLSVIDNQLLRIFIFFIIFDIWMYWWHRLNHEVDFLWLFHRAHHTDSRMDSTTGLRFHPAEIVMSAVFRLPVYFFLGAGVYEVLIYETVLTVSVLFHHSNFALNKTLDNMLRAVIVTPNMHRLHHSQLRHETDSNYSSFLSLWDRIFKTMSYRESYGGIRLGLKGLQGKKWESYKGVMLSPLYGVKRKSQKSNSRKQ